MSQFDQDREDVIRILYSILDYAKLGVEVSCYNSCNNCAKKYCEFKPKPGQVVRWRCPLWEGEEG